ncbi:polysaccharide deacetylase family protein [candidate division KSB1 bacterium]|nr:polysaccharide deacetylase family protein [candidate division KSB1 bacterium]MDL1875853.1 polysaccharide deacetylase family protein [Cytophagia bacterium CHB2]
MNPPQKKNLPHPIVTQYFVKRFERMPELFIKLMPRLWFRAPMQTNQIYLTFDDGPHPERTPFILEVLDHFDIPATFFLIGKRAQRNPDFVRRIAARHRIGNHTWNHPNLRWQNARIFAAELESTRKLLEDLSGASVRLFRPPYGAFGPSLAHYARTHDHQIVLWQILPWDFRPERSAQEIADCILRHGAGGSIIVLHDGHSCAEKTSIALRSCLPLLLEQGYQFSALPNHFCEETAATIMAQSGNDRS